jgi:hypothetical protein
MEAEMYTTVNTIALMLLVGVAVAGCGSRDLAASRQPVTIGSGGSAGRIAVVYDPGASGYPRRTMTRLGKELASRGYVVDLYIAGPGLVFESASYDALVLGSPVYGSETRPDLKDFLTTCAPFPVPVFALLTGLFPKAWYEKYDLPNLTGFLEQNGVTLTAAAKVGTLSSPRYVRTRIASLCDAVEAALGSD